MDTLQRRQVTVGRVDTRAQLYGYLLQAHGQERWLFCLDLVIDNLV